MRTTLLLLFTILFFNVFGNENTFLEWPREIKAEEYTITLYQPQLESLKDNLLDGRMALSVQKGEGDLIFGALWFNARLSTDLESRVAVLEKMEIPMVRFPDVEDESKLESLKKLVINDFESLELEMSIDRILSDVENIEQGAENSDLNNAPPQIYYRDKPTVLVLIDGEPQLRDVEKSNLQYVLNTPFFIVKDKKQFYLKGGGYWYTAEKLESYNWKVTKSVPRDVNKVAEKMLDESEQNPVSEENEEIPEIIVSTKPAELIVSRGKLSYKPLDGTSLLYVDNSESDILMNIASQQHFILINGRWYSSKTLKDGEWSFVEPRQLPEEFAKIPEDATISSVRSSIPGTPEAQEAIYEQQMPQTAVVDRKTATTSVEYDGDPKFEKMEGTDVKYAINTESTVLQIDKKFYCVDNGVWFESSSAKGPWKVADSRPTEVEEIPASAPVHNVKYVYIYDSTPDVVYVGYTPGYYHSYMYGGVVVYGTGFYYRPWYGRYYYPRPVTYGFGVHYNPYTGWGFSVGVSYGWFTFTAGSRYSYWGPRGYCHGYRHGYRHGYHRGYHNGYRAGYARGVYDSRNAYNRNRPGIQQPRVGNSASNRRSNATRPQATPSRKPNNVFTDRNGNVVQRDNNGNWQQKSGRPANRQETSPQNRPQTRPANPQTRPANPQTRPANPQTRPSNPQSRPNSNQFDRSQLERDHLNRNRGNNNYRNYNSNRPSQSMPQQNNRGGSTPQRRSGGRR